MATCIHPSRSCRPLFYTIPIFPLLNRKIFHLLVSLDAHCIYKLYSEEYNYIILPEAICCCLHIYLLSLYRVVGIVLCIIIQVNEKSFDLKEGI